MCKFGEGQYGVDDSERLARLAAFKTAFKAFSEYADLVTFDVLPTDHPRVWQAEWVRHLAGEPVIKAGYIAVYVDDYGRDQPYHCASAEQARIYLETHRAKIEEVRELFRRRDRFSRAMARAMGWCDPGIDDWVSKYLAGRDLSDDSVSVVDLAKAVSQASDSYYVAKLKFLLDGHPALSKS